MSTNAEEVLRKNERVLDEHYKTLPFWTRVEEPGASVAMLASYDQWEFVVQLLGRQDVSFAQKIKSVDEGLSQAVRWIMPHRRGVAAFKDDTLVNDAGEFGNFAATYVTLSDFHKLLGRKIVHAELIDSATLRFVFNPASPTGITLAGFADDVLVAKRRPAIAEVERATRLLAAAQPAVLRTAKQFVDNRLVMEDLDILAAPTVRELAKFQCPGPDPYAKGSEEVDGFTLADFQEVWLTLYAWSTCATTICLARSACGQKGPPPSPTQVVDRALLCSALARYSGVSIEKVRLIVDILTYDDRTAAPDIWQQPLLADSQNIAWSPRLVRNSKHIRNLMKLLARTPSQRDRAATLIGNRDRPFLDAIGKLLVRYGYTYKLKTDYQVGSVLGDVDLLAYSRRAPRQVLVVEGKALLGVDEINEVNQATKEIKKGQGQAAAAVEALRAMSSIQKRILFKFVEWENVSEYFPLVITPGADPDETYDHSDVPSVSLDVMELRLRASELSRPESLWRACRDRPWHAELASLPTRYESVPVGNLRYELPVVEHPNPNDEEPPKNRVATDRIAREG